MVGVASLAAGALAMAGTSSRTDDLEAVLAARKARSVDASLLASVNRARLGVLLEEAQARSGGGDAGAANTPPGDSEARYRAALRGESLGTHSRGTTACAAAISRQQGGGGG